jgi:hypothetical protein
MDNDLALRAILETAKISAEKLPVEMVERCYRLMLSKQFEKDDNNTTKLFEDIIIDYLENGGF